MCFCREVEVGAEDLMQLLKNYSRQSGTQMKGHISVGVVGYPNTGKSSVAALSDGTKLILSYLIEYLIGCRMSCS